MLNTKRWWKVLKSFVVPVAHLGIVSRIASTILFVVICLCVYDLVCFVFFVTWLNRWLSFMTACHFSFGQAAMIFKSGQLLQGFSATGPGGEADHHLHCLPTLMLPGDAAADLRAGPTTWPSAFLAAQREQPPHFLATAFTLFFKPKTSACR